MENNFVTIVLALIFIIKENSSPSDYYLLPAPKQNLGGQRFNPLNAELNPICYLLALLGAHHFLHVSRIRVKSSTLRLLISYIYIYTYMTLVA